MRHCLATELFSRTVCSLFSRYRLNHDATVPHGAIIYCSNNGVYCTTVAQMMCRADSTEQGNDTITRGCAQLRNSISETTTTQAPQFQRPPLLSNTLESLFDGHPFYVRRMAPVCQTYSYCCLLLSCRIQFESSTPVHLSAKK